jgi:excisionase family DNA binding protein
MLKLAAMNKEEAAEFLGVKPRTIERYTQLNKLTPTYQKGKRGQVAVYDQAQLEKLKAELSQPIYPHRPVVEDGSSDSQALAPTNTVTDFARFVEAVGASIGSQLIQAQSIHRSIADLAAKLTLTLNEASQLAGLSRNFLLEAIHDKKLKAAKRGRGWNIKRVDLDAYVAKL